MQTRARGVHEGTSASSATEYISREQVMCAEYSCANLVGQETSGCGEHHDIATRKRYRRWGTGVTIYEDSARQEQELLPGGEVRVGVTRIMYQIQKFGKFV